MNAKKGTPKDVDAVIVSVLMDTEHPALLATFGLRPFAEPHQEVNGVKIWHTRLETIQGEPLNVDLACLAGGGNTNSVMRTRTVLDVIHPKSIYLVGTAGGRKDRTSICDVVVSSDGIMYYESGRALDSGTGSKPKYAYPKPPISTEVISFHTLQIKSLGWKEEYNSILRNLQQDDISLPIPDSEPKVHLDMIASGEKILGQRQMKSICNLHDSVRAAETEGYGFAEACDQKDVGWLVIRGISDHGRREDKEKWKMTATVMAASFLKMFLKHAFQSPRQIETLTEDSIYVGVKIPDIVRQVLRQNAIDITPVKFSLDFTINDLESICHTLYPAIPSAQLKKIVRQARASAFEHKYADRTEEDDERFMDIEQWKAEFRNLLRHLSILDLNSQRVINVGIGNGLGTEGLFDEIENFTGLDISPRALAGAKERCPKMLCMLNDAEDLRDVENSSQDVYISLRTYQSTLFDVNAALLEAYRVLRPGGMIVVSIPYIFIDKNKGMVKGLLFPESDEVDPDLPYRFVDIIRKRLNLLNFDRIGIRTGMVEVYVYGQRGR